MIAAILSGPSYGAPNHDERSIEVFNHIGEVVEAMFDRYSSNGKRTCDVRTLDGGLNLTLFPTFGEGCQFTCYEIAASVPMTTGQVSTQLRESVVMEVLAAVHGGHWDWDVELIATDSELMTVNVEKAGMS